MPAIKQALVIAAGNGSRLQPASGELPKPLTPLCGVPLLKRLLVQMAAAGIESCVIVLGYQADALRLALSGDPEIAVKLDFIVNPDWKLPNGLSVLKAKEKFRDDFVLLMADHLFDGAILCRLLRRRCVPGEVILAVDRKIDQVFDIDDATKVKLNGTQVLEIGKGLKDFNAVDTGMFLCSPGVFAALEDSIAAGDASLSGGMKHLIAKGRLRFFDVKEAWWLDVDTPAALRQAERDLFAQLPSQRSSYAWSKPYQILGHKLTRFLLNKSIDAATAVFASLAAALLSAVLLAWGSYASMLAGAFILQGAVLFFDAARNLSHLSLEHTPAQKSRYVQLQNFIFITFFAGLSLGVYRGSGKTYLLVLGAFLLFDAVLTVKGNEPGESPAAPAEGAISGLPAPGGLQHFFARLEKFGQKFFNLHALALVSLLVGFLGRPEFLFWISLATTHLTATGRYYAPDTALSRPEAPVAEF